MLKLLCSIFLFLHLSNRRRVFSSFLIIFSHPSSPLDTFTVVARSRYINWVWCEFAVLLLSSSRSNVIFLPIFSLFPSFSFYCLMNLEEERILRSNVHFHSAGLLVWWSLSSSTHSRSSSQVRCHIVSRPSGIFRIKSETDPHFSGGDFATYPIQNTATTTSQSSSSSPRFVVRQSENIFPISGKSGKMSIQVCAECLCSNKVDCYLFGFGRMSEKHKRMNHFYCLYQYDAAADASSVPMLFPWEANKA